MTKKIILVDVGTPKAATVNRWTGSFDHIRIESRRSVYLDGVTLSSLQETIEELQEEYGGEYTDLQITSRCDCSCWDSDCGCSPTYYVQGKRIESDIEYEFRLQSEQKAQEDRDRRERMEFERLQQKFGDAS